MSVATLSARHLRLTALLQVDGLRECFYLGPVAPPAPTHAGLGAVTYTVHPGLDAMSSVGSSLSLTDAVPSASRVSLRVGIAPDGAARALLRLAPTGAPTQTTLTDSLPPVQNGAPLVVQCADSVANFTVPGLAWIGREAVYLSARNVGALTVTIAANGRGQLGTLIEAHTASPAVGWAPRLYSACVTWRQRRARVWVGQLTAAGTWLTPPVVEVEGWMPVPPAAVDARTVGLEIETLPAALDVEVGTAETAETGLQAGAHLFDGAVGNRWDALTQVWGPRGVYNRPPDAAAVAGSVTITGSVGALGSVFMGSGWSVYPALRGALVRGEADPSRIDLAAAPVPGALGPDDPSGTINVDPTPFGVGNFTLLMNDRAEVRPVYVFGTPGAAEVVDWPPLAAFNAGLATQPNAGWLNHNLDDSGRLALVPLWTIRTDGVLGVRAIAPTTATCWGLMLGDSMPRLQNGIVQAETWPRYAPAGRRDLSDRRPRGSASIPAEYIVRTGGRLVIQLGAIATAWWQPPERYMLVSGDIVPGATAASPRPVLVIHEADGEERRSAVRIIGSQAAGAITPGAVGFALEIHPDDRTGYAIADLPGGRPATIRAVAAWTRRPVGFLARELLASVCGSGSNGTFDVQSYGAAVPQALIDVASFAAVANGAAGRRTVLLDEGASPRDVLSSLARSVGYLVVERLNRATGRRQLAMVPAGLPTPFEVVDSIADGDWLAEGRPVMSIDEQVINRVEGRLSTGQLIAYRRNLPEGAEYTVSVTDRDSVGEHGGATTEEIDLLGVVADPNSASALRDVLLPIAQSRFAAYGYPRRQVSGAVAYGRGVGLDAGSVVRVAGAELLAYDGTPLGSGGALARVTSVDRDVVQQVVRITATYWQARTAGWAPAMRVTFIVGAALTVLPSFYSPSVDSTGTPQIDSDFFNVGDQVLCVPRGNRAGAAVRTITAKGVGTVTLNAAPPIGMALGSVRLVSYALATAAQRDHCFLADAALTIPLGVGSDPAQSYT